ncbi:MAG: hypothetical protein AAF957_03030 [Planctomycetota bacterium]
MTQPLLGFLAFAVGTVVVLTVPVLAVWLVVHLVKGLTFVAGGAAKGVGYGIRHVARFVRGTVVDSLQFGGSIVTAAVVLPLAVANGAIGRFRAARHYGAALEDELTGALAALYRVGLGHPVRFLGLGALTDGLERRLPDLVEREPRTADARRRASRARVARFDEEPTFEGYTVQSELQAGGSGARLFLATPTADHANLLASRGLDVPSRVVIKAFDRGYGSTIPQIVRESRSLEAAKRLGLILEHAVDDDAFHYVMPFVPGEDLDATTRTLHARSSGDGLDARSLSAVLGYARDLCDHLDRFHGEGLWHKDIKPSNLMVADGRLHVVDFGLVTPLESALTLTTHGTEFFRDPELVRLALAGRRVKDVDGVKFDLYSAGAVLYSMVENSFPAHGSLSSITKPAPEALRWIVRRSMADVDKRYASAREMARDLDVLLAAKDPYTVRPADLPSIRGDASIPPSRPGATTVASPAPGLGGSDRADDLHGAAASDDAQGDANDVRRFSAFGMTAEVHGLGRIKESIHGVREDRRRKRAERTAQRHRDAAAAREAKHEARAARRRKRRGVMGAVLTLAVFVGIAGGAGTWIYSARQGHSVFEGHASYDGHGGYEGHHADPASRAYPVLAAPATPPGYPAPPKQYAPAAETWSFHASVETTLLQLGDSARVLVLTDENDRGATRDARSAAQRLQALGIQPVGVALGPGGTLSRREVELLGDARYEIEQARGSVGGALDRLEAFADDQPMIDAILWLDRPEPNGYLQTKLAIEDFGGIRQLDVRPAQGTCASEDACSADSAWTSSCSTKSEACATSPRIQQ